METAKAASKQLSKQRLASAYLKAAQAGEYKRAKRILETITRRPTSTAGPQTQPLYVSDAHDATTSRKEEILELLASLYKDLLAGTTMTSVPSPEAEAFWRRRFPAEYEARKPTVETPNHFSWKEVVVVLRALLNGKAPGRDGVTHEVLKAAIDKIDTLADNDVAPESAFGATILVIINLMFKYGYIPEVWRTTIMSAILKKDVDPADRFSYRGLAMICSMVGVATRLVTGRLNSVLEAGSVLPPYQRGFRLFHETLAHVCSILEMIGRRRHEGLCTLIAFIDLEKAFDRAEIQLMLNRLFQAGANDQIVDFIRALYTNATATLRHNGLFSATFPINCGVKQGCCASPTEWSVFVLTVLHQCEAEHLGGKVPGMADLLLALLFADDLIVFAENEEQMRQILHNLSIWACQNHLKYNIKKCAIMGIGADKGDDTSHEEVLRVQAGKHPLKLGSSRASLLPVPVKDKYLYLGVILHRSFDLEHTLTHRKGLGNKCYYAIKTFLCLHEVHGLLRVTQIRQQLNAVLAYGSEAYGMPALNRKSLVLAHLSPCQDLALVNTIRTQEDKYIVQDKGTAAVLRREYNMPSIMELGWINQLRMYISYRTNPKLRNTVLANFVHNPSNIPGTWTWQTHAFCRKFLPSIYARTNGLTVSFLGFKRALATAARTLQRENDEKALGGHTGFNRYTARRFEFTRMYLSHSLAHFASYAQEIGNLTRARCKQLTLAPAKANAHKLPPRFTTTCPCCNREGVIEDEYHLLFCCPAFRAERLTISDITAEVVGLIRRWTPDDSSLEQRTLAVTLLLGGSRMIHGPRGAPWPLKLPNWLPKKKSDPSPTYLRIAKYLTKVMLKRRDLTVPIEKAHIAHAICTSAILRATALRAAAARAPEEI